MHGTMSTTEVFLIALLIIFSIPYLVWRIARIDYYVPLVVKQLIGGVVIGPRVIGVVFSIY